MRPAGVWWAEGRAAVWDRTELRRVYDRTALSMEQTFRWSWIEAQAADSGELWHGCAAREPRRGVLYSRAEQRVRERAYDRALEEVECEARTKASTAAARRAVQARTTASLARFSTAALDLGAEATGLLTDDFLPVGTGLARWARRFDAGLGKEEIVQACRNAWTACGLQPLFGEAVGLTPSIAGYSLLYPYTDNYLDRPEIGAEEKHRFSERFRQRLSGGGSDPVSRHECALWELVGAIEAQYPRAVYPAVYGCLLAIHRAQEDSLAQLNPLRECTAPELLRISCAKGGSSVLADACLARGTLTEQESSFAFRWGVLLQLGDDLQDVDEDMRRGSWTLFSRAAALRLPLDALADQLLVFGEVVAEEMDALPHGSATLKGLLRMSWRSLIVTAVAASHGFFTRGYVARREQESPFRFDFLRARGRRMRRRRGLYDSLFDVFVEDSGEGAGGVGLAVRPDAAAVACD
ncbi:MAG: hypothetical protein M3O02_07770 [Acidobacteriota bacterium]|nr:hypothetical protein [Acidobacteriota bacterium]